MPTRAMSKNAIEVNGRRYAWPKHPLVVICIDGCEPDYAESDGGGYIERAMAAGAMPFVARMLASGTRRLADCVVPAFTNPNNISIVTGAPPSVHGICGNYFLDPDTQTEVMMNDPKFLRAGTIFSAFADAGATVELVERLLEHTGLEESRLLCPPDLPGNEQARAEVLAAGAPRRAVYMNCSGKQDRKSVV